MDYLGIDAGATWIKAARFTSALAMGKPVRVPSGGAAGPEAYFASIASAATACGAGEVAAVGLALPGLLTPDGKRLKYTANITGLGVGSAGAVLAQALGTSLGTANIVAENDAACAALGEWWDGRGERQPSARLLHLTWGTGIGTGLVVGGRAEYGWQGGHVPLGTEQASYACNCGSKIDVEALVSAPHLVAEAREMVRQSSLTTKLTAEALADAAEAPRQLLQGYREEDAVSKQVIDRALANIARGLHAMAVIAYPTIVTIGGGMMADDGLLDQLRHFIESQGQGMTKVVLQPHIVHRAQLGNNAGIVGAAMLARQTFK